MADTNCLLILVSVILILKCVTGNVVQTPAGVGPDMEGRLRKLEAQVQSLQRDIQLLESTGKEAFRFLRNLVFGVAHQVTHKPACQASEIHGKLEYRTVF